MTIGKNLQLLRKEKGLTQEQVAQIIGVTRQTISGYESGRTQPDIETLGLLAKAYAVDIEAILYGTAARNSRNGLKRIACILAAILLVLSLASACFYFADSLLRARTFHVSKDENISEIDWNSRASQEEIQIYLEKDAQLNKYRNHADGLLRIISTLGSVYLLAALLQAKTKIPAKTKLLSSAGFCIILLAIPTLIGLFDPCGLHVNNYIFTQQAAACTILIAALVEIGAEKLQKKKV